MKVVRAASELDHGTRQVCLAIGVFDGVHLGHQHIIQQTLAAAQPRAALAVVVTFEPHPNAVVAPDRVPPRIYARSQKLRALAGLGVDAVIEIPFDRACSQQNGRQFVLGLARDLGSLQNICVGAEFVFGHRRSGNVALLQALGAENQFQVQGLPAVMQGGQIVSSTRIRECIRSGDLAQASQLLGRPYALCGAVVAGDQLGRQWGFPTANLEVSGLGLPPRGVYAATASVEGHRYPAAVNVGTRPTVAGAAAPVRVEAHLLGFQGDLYGRELELEWGVKLREEQRFASPVELRAQIERDLAAVRAAAGLA